MAQTQKQRMALIRKTSKKFNKKLQRNNRVRKTETRSFSLNPNGISDHMIYGENINHWTDAPKYVDQYYGDRARAQESYERDWD